LPSDSVEDVGEEVVFQHTRCLRRKPAAELARLDQRHHEPRQAERRDIGADRTLRLAALKDAGEGFGDAGDAAVQGGANVRLELESVSILEKDAEHRGCMQMIEVIRRQEMLQPLIGALVLASQHTHVSGGLLGDVVESGREELSLGAKVLEDHRLGDADTRRHVGHTRVFIPSGGENGHGCIEDGRTPGGGIESLASWSLLAGSGLEDRSRAHNGHQLANFRIIVDRDLSRD
jgi:hypothetical protein